MSEPRARAFPDARFRHPEIHVVAGCVVVHVGPDGSEDVERVWAGQPPQFWGHYRVDPHGRQMWVDDYDRRDVAIQAARACPGRCPVFLEVDGALSRLPRA